MAVEVKIIADTQRIYRPTPFSGEIKGRRITTIQVRYWRAIHSELMTHRVFSRNASSSRAIPVWKVLRQVLRDCATPVHWGANRPGMQASDELTGWRLRAAKLLWKSASIFAVAHAWAMMKVGLHKQVANRVLEPYQFISVVITSTEWENFFALRNHPDAQPEIQELALAMDEAMAMSTPANRWYHLPYVDDHEFMELRAVLRKDNTGWSELTLDWEAYAAAAKLSAARCARVSYLTHDGERPSQEADRKLYQRLVGSMPIHASPTEHQARCSSNPLERSGNLVGWIQNRKELVEVRL
jgi:thymidylate synthase ThyX